MRRPAHPCLYKRERKGVFIMLGVHVDDGLMGCSHKAEFKTFQEEFMRHVTNATVSETVLKFTGTTMVVNREEHYVRLSHAVYIEQRFADYTKTEHVPMRHTVNLRVALPVEGAPLATTRHGSLPIHRGPRQT